MGRMAKKIGAKLEGSVYYGSHESREFQWIRNSQLWNLQVNSTSEKFQGNNTFIIIFFLDLVTRSLLAILIKAISMDW